MDPPTGPSLGRYDYDLLVVGGGSGGLAVAKEAAGLSRKVLIIDHVTPLPGGISREMGGFGLHGNSIRKLLQQAALLGKAIEDAEKYGWRLGERAAHSWSELVAAVQEELKTRSCELRRELMSCGVFHLSGHGELVAPHTVEVTEVNGRKRRLSAETLVIATGDRPQYLGVPGDRQYCWTSEDLLFLPHPPARTLVVGGSAEGLESAGFLLGLGLPVTVLLQPGLLPGFDRKMAQKIENHLMVSGVRFLRHCSLTKVEQTEAASERKARLRVTVVFQDDHSEQEDFDTVLLAVGRKAATSGIGLERVGVECSQDSGGILVDSSDQTSVDHIYAIGSVQHGRPPTAGLSVHAGTLLARRLYRGDAVLCDYGRVPRVLLTPLEYAACGLSEEDAILTHGEASVEVYHSFYWPLEWTLPARNKNSCYVKVICCVPDHERVVGVHIMGPNAGDVLQGFVAAMRGGLTKQQLDATVGIQPGTAQVLCSLTQTQRMFEASLLRGNC